jgi:hypothetical protein
MVFSETDFAALADAVNRLERPGFAGRVAGLAGKPAGFVVRTLPAPAAAVVAKAVENVLSHALDVALFSLHNRWFAGGRVSHSALASASGAVGGAFGLAALAIELPVSTTIMLRAIAAIARDEGENLADPRTGLACLEVFALGRPAAADAVAGERGYFAVRALLARGLTETAEIVVNKGAVGGGSDLAARLLAPIAARFGAVVSEKLAAQAVAVIGAVGGAAVNLAFIEHFQSLARGHFAVRRLERVYGAEAVRTEYDLLRSPSAGAA